MPVSHNFLKCVAFVASTSTSGEHPIGGTVFFASYPSDNADQFEVYAVTARHVIEEASEKSCDGKVLLRVNKHGGEVAWLETVPHSWEFHEDDKIDVAISPLDWSEEDVTKNYDHLPIHSESFLTDELVHKLEITPGEELFFPGLFVHHPGRGANIPILRTGTIAAMPAEKVRTTTGMARVHLAEIRSIGGHSGSPVFLNLNSIERLWELRKRPMFEEHCSKLTFTPFFGLLIEHFLIRPDEWTAQAASHGAASQAASDTARKQEDFNAGIAIIIPASDILHVLNKSKHVGQLKP